MGQQPSHHVLAALRRCGAQMSRDLKGLLDTHITVSPGQVEWSTPAATEGRREPWLVTTARYSLTEEGELHLYVHARDATMLAGRMLLVPASSLRERSIGSGLDAQFRDAFDEIGNLLSSSIDVAFKAGGTTANVHVRQTSTAFIQKGLPSWPKATERCIVSRFGLLMPGFDTTPRGLLLTLPTSLIERLG